MILELLKNRVSQALVAAFGEELAGVDPLVVPASNPRFGDYQSNVALSLPKQLKQIQGRSPNKLRTKLILPISVKLLK